MENNLTTENDCIGIQTFLDETVDEWEIIKNQYDLVFKDKKRLLVIREFIVQQLHEVDSALTTVNISINRLDDRYSKYKENALNNKDFE
jgi:CRISPR/Cas system-associated endonuclease Cas1